MPGYPTDPGANPYGPQVTFQTTSIFPPAAVYLGANDQLTLLVRNPLVAANLQLSYRLLMPDGEIKTTETDFSFAAMGSLTQVEIIPPTEAFILSASISGPGLARGQCFVKLFVTVGVFGPDPVLGALLIQGYCADDDRLSYPQTPTESSLSGRGNTRVVQLATPGLGNPITAAMPTGVRWILKNAIAEFATSVAVPARSPFLRVITPGPIIAVSIPSPASVPASSSVFLNWAEGAASLVGGINSNAPLPVNLLLPTGAQIMISTLNFDGNDFFSGGALTVEEFVGA